MALSITTLCRKVRLPIIQLNVILLNVITLNVMAIIFTIEIVPHIISIIPPLYNFFTFLRNLHNVIKLFSHCNLLFGVISQTFPPL
jgi:hypothetical protein